MIIKKGATARNFPLVTFEDKYKKPCGIQLSSLADDRCIWIGADDADPKIMSSVGWVKYDIPNEVLLSTRMHLSMEMVKELLPILQHFAETGEII